MSSRLNRAASAHLRSPRVAVWAGLLAVIALLCATQPLLDVLGYTYAFAIALVASLASADLGATLVRRARATDAHGLDNATGPGRVVAALFARAAAVNLGILVVPLLVSSLNALRVRNCDWWFGLTAYLGLTALSALAGTVAGVATALLAGRRRVLSNVLPHAVVLGWWGAAVWHFYTEPPLFAYNAFGGYFAGNLYDENIALTAPFYWSRLFQALVGTAALALAAMLLDVPSLTVRWLRQRRPMGLRRRPTALAMAAAALAALLFFSAAELGFAVDARDIRAALGGRHETAHFVIYYRPGGEIEEDIELIAEDHELRYAQVLRAFGLAPGGDKILSYYFDSPEQKRRWFGAERVHMARPWQREIFVNHKAFPHVVLRHELAHIVAGAFGDPLFGVSVDTVLGVPAFFNVGLIEGAAVAADWPGHRSDLTPHQAVRALRELDYEPPLERLFDTGFFQFASSRSYTTAGSFVYFLLSEHGAPKLRALYRSGGDFRAAYGVSLGELAAQWRLLIARTELPPGTAEAVRERFRRRAVFERPCPHAIARRRHRMAEMLARGDREGAIRLSRAVCKDSPGEPSYQLELAQLLLLDRRPDDAREVYRRVADDLDYSTTIRAQAYLALADLAGRDGDTAAALAQLAAADALPIDDDTRRQLAARQLAANHTGPAGPHLRAYFWKHPLGSTFAAAVGVARASAAAAAEPDLGLPRYLIGLQLFQQRAWHDAVEHLAAAAARELHPLVARRNAELLAIAAYRIDDYDAVLRAADVLARADQPETVRWLARDWRERVHWKRTGELLP